MASDEQLFFGLSQALRKFPKETGKYWENLIEKIIILAAQTSFMVHTDDIMLRPDKVLCHFCFKQKKVTNGVLAIDNSRKSQILISSIILLKTALDALPLLSKVHKPFSLLCCTISS